MGNNNFKKNTDLEVGKEDFFDLKIATTLEEKVENYKFRYKIYVEEMEKTGLNINYKTKELTDELDDWGILINVKHCKKLIAIVRLNIGTINDFPEEVTNYLSLHEFTEKYSKSEIPKFAFISKLMITPEYRSSTALYKMMNTTYKIFCENNIHFAFAGCSFHLLRLYEQMGFQQYTKNFVQKGYGLLSAIVLLTQDIDHLRKVKSPFYRIAKKINTKNSPKQTKWFYEKYIYNSNTVNSQLITADELWTILCFKLHGIPTKKIKILNNLSIEEAKIFLHSCASIVNCDVDEVITLQGEISYSYNVLLSGKLQSQTFINPKQEYTQSGEHFGANGLTEHNKHIESIAAITPVEILILTSLAFARFYNTHFEIAHKIASNILNASTTK